MAPVNSEQKHNQIRVTVLRESCRIPLSDVYRFHYREMAMKVSLATIMMCATASVVLGSSAWAQQFGGGCLNLNSDQCASLIAPGIWESVGGNSSFWETYENSLGEPPPRTPELVQACYATCQQKYQLALNNCTAGLLSLVTEPDALDAEAARASCVAALLDDQQACISDCEY